MFYRGWKNESVAKHMLCDWATLLDNVYTLLKMILGDSILQMLPKSITVSFLNTT